MSEPFQPSSRDGGLTSNEGSAPSAEDAEPNAGAQPLTLERKRRLGALYEAHWAELVLYIRRSFGPGPPDPEDAVQTAFSQFAALPKPEDVEAPRAFLYRLAANVVLDFKRKAKVRTRFATGAEPNILFGGQEEITPERILDAKQRADILRHTLDNMKHAYREALLLNRVHAMSIAQIARHLSISESEARRRITKAISICTQTMEALETDRCDTSEGGKP